MDGRLRTARRGVRVRVDRRRRAHGVDVASTAASTRTTRPDASSCPRIVRFPIPLDLLAFLAGQHRTAGACHRRAGAAEPPSGGAGQAGRHPRRLVRRPISAVRRAWDGSRRRSRHAVRSSRSRGRRADEQLEVMRLLFADRPGGASFHGEFFDFDNAMCYPKPVSRVPIHIGGHSSAAARRAGRLGDGFQPLGVGGTELTELIAVMRDEAIQFGRDPEALEISLGHLVAKIDTDRAAKLAALGADRVVLAMPPTADLSEARDVAVRMCAAAGADTMSLNVVRPAGTDRPGSSLRVGGRRPPIRRCCRIIHRDSRITAARPTPIAGAGAPSPRPRRRPLRDGRTGRRRTAPSTRSSARCTPRATMPTTRWAESRASPITGPSSDGQVSDLVWHLRYDDEYLRTRAGWRIHGRALTINAIETRPVRRLREQPSGGRAAAADPSAASTEPQPRKTNHRGRFRDTP